MDLPDHLRQTAINNQWIEFAESYMSKKDALEKNKNLRAFASILDEVEGSVSRAEKTLNNVISKECDDPMQLGECYGAIIRMHPEQAESMEMQFIEKLKKYCEKTIEQFGEKKQTEIINYTSQIATAGTTLVGILEK